MLITKLDDGLAVRIPDDVVRNLDLKVGDTVDFLKLDDGKLALVAREHRRLAALKRLAEMARPAPPGYKFDREEANAR